MLSRIRQFLFSPSTTYSVFIILVSGIVIGFVAVVGTLVTMNVTSSNQFCQVCHEMNIAVSEYKSSSHYANSVGIQASCADCHLTHRYPAKLFAKASKIKDLWHHLLGSIDTPEKYEKKRLVMAEIEWKHLQDSDSETCRYCHSIKRMSKQTLHAERAHARAVNNEITCIVCHIGVAHKLPNIPLPDAARPQGEGKPVQCSGCHRSMKNALPGSHPEVEVVELAQCISCHIADKKQETEKGNFYTFMHNSHKNHLSCKDCHDLGDGSMKLLYDDRKIM